MERREINPLAYEPSKWDSYLMQEVEEVSTSLQKTLQEGANKVYSFPSFGEEVFHRLYNQNENPLPTDEIKGENQWAYNSHKLLEKTEEWKSLTRTCQGDQLLTGVATTTFCQEVNQTILPKDKKGQVKQDPQELRDQIKALLNLGNQIKEKEGEFPKGLQNQIEKLKKQGKKAVQQSKDFADKIKQDQSAFRSAVRQAAQNAQSKAEEMQDCVSTWGSNAGTGESGGSVQDKINLAKQVAQFPKLQKLAKLAGRMKMIAAEKQRQKTDKARSEVNDIEMGNDLSRLLPSELMKLGNDQTTLLFQKSYLERSLLQYKLSGKEAANKGPIVVCIDNSSSMGGERELWSKSIAMALGTIAKQQKRSFKVVHFSAKVERVDNFPKGKPFNSENFMNSMIFFSGGGTNFIPPLREALASIKEEKDFKKADVIFITDDCCSIEQGFIQEFNQAKKKYDFSCYGIVIGGSTANLSKVADPCLSIDNLASDGDVLDSVFKI